MKKILFIASLIITALISCDDTTGSLGSSIADFDDNIIYSTDTFGVITETQLADSIAARSLYSYLGRFNDKETNSTMTANFMTQFVPRNESKFFYEIDSLKNNKGTGTAEYPINYVDTCYLVVYMSSFTGDSLAKMKVVAKELNKPYSASRRYTIYYDPVKDDMIWKHTADLKGGVESSAAYTIHNSVYDLENNTTAGVHSIFIPLDEELIRTVKDKDGVTKENMHFNNYGSYVMWMYYNHNDYFASPALFNKYVCPGFYIENTYGQGAIGKITSSMLEFAYNINYPKDSTVIRWFTGTKEVMQQSTIKEDVEGSIQTFVDECNKSTSDISYIKSPMGIYTTATLDIDSVITDAHVEDTLSTARIFIPRLNNTSSSEYTLSPPSKLLLVRADSIYAFFDKQKVYDNKTSFITSFSSTTNGYTFDNISKLITIMYNDRKKDMETLGITSKEDYEKLYNPDWNKVYLVPVEISSDTNGNILSVAHSMLIQGTRLKRGTREKDSPIKLSVIYSRFR